jgi:C-terminal processing protease CtpA/Prc
MTNRFYRRWLGWSVFLGLAGWLHGAAAQDAVFKEVYELLRTNLTGLTQADLDRAAVQGLVSQLQPKVTLVKSEPGASGTNAGPAVTASVLDVSYGAMRIGQFGPETAGQFNDAYQRLSSSNRLKGLVLDLRFADGDDYAGAKAIADNFFTAEQPLIDWGEGVKKSTPKDKAINLPLVILVNQKTSGPAEALAAILHEYDAGLVLGAKTAGHANIAKQFTLSNGQRLRIATAPVKVARDQPVALDGLTPDIQVVVNPEEEQTWFADPYRNPLKPERAVALSGATNDTRQAITNRSRRHVNEAELVRMQRDGQTLDFETNLVTRDAGPAKPMVQDPVLVRALDLLKGLAVVQRTRPL